MQHFASCKQDAHSGFLSFSLNTVLFRTGLDHWSKREISYVCGFFLYRNLLNVYTDFLLGHYCNLSSVQSLVLEKFTSLTRWGREWPWVKAFRLFPLIYSKLQEATNTWFLNAWWSPASPVPKHVLLESTLWKLANICYRHVIFTFQNLSSIFTLNIFAQWKKNSQRKMSICYPDSKLGCSQKCSSGFQCWRKI